MKVQVDKQGWKMIDGGAPCEGSTAVDQNGARSATAVPGSGVFAKVENRESASTETEEVSTMDTIPVPSSEEPDVVIPAAASVPRDLVAITAAASGDDD